MHLVRRCQRQEGLPWGLCRELCAMGVDGMAAPKDVSMSQPHNLLVASL